MAVVVGVGTSNVPRPPGSSPLQPTAASASATTAVIKRAVITRQTITRTLGAVAERFAPLLRDQRAALIGLLTDLPAERWKLPTVCTGWDVKDVAGHLVENELLFGRLYRGEIDDLSADNEEGVERWRKVDPETVRYSLWHHGQAAQRVIDSRPDASWARTVSHFGLPMELRRALVMQFFELAVHSHDISSALGVPPIWDDRTGPLVEYFFSLAPLALALTPAGSAIEITVDGIGTTTLDGTSGEWLLGDASDPATTWHTDAETLILVTTGRRPIAEAIAATKVEGHAALLESVLADWQLAR